MERGEERIDCRDWSAWHNHEPPGPPVLRVRGECECPTPGFSVELKRHEPQGINPKDLLLDRIVHEPSGSVPQVITVVEVQYSEETDFEYDTVTILPDGPSISVQDVDGLTDRPDSEQDPVPPPKG